MIKIISIILLLLCSPLISQLCKAQILDDSTVSIYGPITVALGDENLIIKKQGQVQRPDTSINLLHTTNEWLNPSEDPQKNGGYIGAQQQPFFYDRVHSIGLSSGRDAFSYLFYTPEMHKYITTYGLYTKAHYNQGSYGRQWIEAAVSRNVSSNINIGGIYRRLTGQRQINVTRFKQKSVDHNAYLIHSNGRFFKNRLRGTFAYSHMGHKIYETGGVRASEQDKSIDSLLDYELEQARLDISSATREIRSQLHTTLGFDLINGITAYASTDFYSQTSYFLQPNIGVRAYDNYFFQQDTTAEAFRYKARTFTAGLLFKVGPASIDAFARRRIINNTGSFSTLLPTVYENHIGGIARFDVSTFNVLARGEYIVGRDYLLEATANQKLFSATVYSQATSIAQVYRSFIGNHYLFTTNKELVYVNGISGQINIPAGKSLISPVGKIYIVKDQPFFREGDTAVNFGRGTILTLGIKNHIKLGAFNLQGTLIYTKTADFYPSPNYYAYQNLYGEKTLAKGKYVLQFGIEVQYRTAFNGQVYDPSTGQFFVQNPNYQSIGRVATPYFGNPTHTLVSPFLNVKINRTRVYLKVGNVLQGIADKGYFDIPYYPGMRRYFEFGVDWQFFN